MPLKYTGNKQQTKIYVCVHVSRVTYRDNVFRHLCDVLVWLITHLHSWGGIRNESVGG